MRLSIQSPQGIGERRKMAQSAFVHLALEGDDVVHGIPEIHPAPKVEFRRFSEIEANMRFVTDEAQQEPHLFLADTKRPFFLTQITARQLVAKPSRRGT